MLDKSFLRADIFNFAMNASLKDNLCPYLISTVSNMLALNYASDEKLRTVEKDMPHYANNLADKLLKYLGEEVVLDEEFEAAMQLFIIAITPGTPDREAPPDLAQNKEKVVSVVNDMCFPDGDFDATELLAEILNHRDGVQSIDLLISNPGTLKSMIQKGLSPKNAAIEAGKMSIMSAKSSHIMSDFQQFSGLILCGLIGCIANVGAVHFIDAIAVVTVVPTSVIALKYGTQLGEIIGGSLAKLESGFKDAKVELAKAFEDFTPSFNDAKTKEIKAITSQIDIADSKLNDAAKDISSHISTEEDIKKMKDFDMIKQKAKSLGRDAF